MKKLGSLHVVTMVIGVISIAIGLYSALKGNAYSDYWLSVTMGIILLGTAYFESRKVKKAED
jgi:ribose/xylose/arabinose/galactoside ABC-type transport system permease subunit